MTSQSEIEDLFDELVAIDSDGFLSTGPDIEPLPTWEEVLEDRHSLSKLSLDRQIAVITEYFLESFSNNYEGYIFTDIDHFDYYRVIPKSPSISEIKNFLITSLILTMKTTAFFLLMNGFNNKFLLTI